MRSNWCAQRVDLAGHGHQHGHLLRRCNHVVVAGRGASEAAVDPIKGIAALGVHEKAVDGVEEVVAGGAVHGPVGRQRFPLTENLLRHDEQRPMDVRRLPSHRDR